ncbi:uncharacterized protein BCR38DRAFT_460575 [Pseudomassariella vexata]|uniref:HD domain-containing protein n=1 Tax=Pseudomassariella vexata TaxID=1141098 RepID=A0A1Y2DJ93_9PEZI|nr:uncharacterized protein BCR38DRAFT_460575 [Pseudomassariella vexata]ORY59279.1 hypothetical protein BCR38DRAFT_460575 [Pseudomassariella vexata]
MFISKTILLLTCLAVRKRGDPVLSTSPYPNTTIAGITVIDTPTVRAAIEFSRNHSSEAVFLHQMRAWLFGSLIIAGNETLRNSVDIEVQAVSALLHDLGWSMAPNSTIVSSDKRFEVDGAIAARKFLADYGDDGWDARRTQLVWDAIALHTTRTIGYYKEYEVSTTSMGISVDYDGLKPGVTNETFATIIKEFPNDELKKVTNDTFTWICATKPAVTYDTQLQSWGERYVANYSTEGNLRIDHIFDNL